MVTGGWLGKAAGNASGNTHKLQPSASRIAASLLDAICGNLSNGKSDDSLINSRRENAILALAI